MLKKALALFCLLALAVSVLPGAALADSGLYTDSVVVQPQTDAGVSRYIFARTGSGWFAENEVELQIGAGMMVAEGNLPHSSHRSEDALYCYPPMEVKVWRWDAGQTRWVMEQNYDVYSERSATIELNEDNCSYCIQLYFWNPLTVAKSYHTNKEFFYPSPWLMRGMSVTPDSARWASHHLPTITATPGDDTKLFRSNPLGHILPGQQ